MKKLHRVNIPELFTICDAILESLEIWDVVLCHASETPPLR